MSSFTPAPNQNQLNEADLPYITHSIIVGNGEVPAVQDVKGLVWALPGGETTRDIVTAYRCAERLDAMITPNLRKFRRTLMRT